MQNETPPPAALPAHIQFSNSNLRDFIRARGKDVPVLINAASLKQFIHEVAEEWKINLVSVPKKLLDPCLRAATIAATSTLEAYIKEKFPSPVALIEGGDPVNMPVPATLPRYTVENAVDRVTKAAETAARPWVLSYAHHTNPNRQAAGRAAAAVRATEPPAEAPVVAEAASEPEIKAQAAPDPITLVAAAITTGATHQEQKTQAAVVLADSEFERGDIPFSSAGRDNALGKAIMALNNITPVEMTAPPATDTLDAWLTEHGLRTMDCGVDGWICLVAGLADTAINSKSGMSAALKQGIVVAGPSEILACFAYSQRNTIMWPEELG